MRIETAKTAGFCFGVRRAVEMVQEEAAKAAGRYPVCTLGPIIHNDTVIRQLQEAGVTVIESPEEAPGDGWWSSGPTGSPWR